MRQDRQQIDMVALANRILRGPSLDEPEPRIIDHERLIDEHEDRRLEAEVDYLDGLQGNRRYDSWPV